MEHQLRVAYVDDSGDLRDLMVETFSEHGIDAYVTERETADIAEIATWRPDVLVIDPIGRKGTERPPFEVSVSARQVPDLAHIPIVLLADRWMLAHHSDEVDVIQPAATLPKPFSPAELVKLLRRVVDRGRDASTP